MAHKTLAIIGGGASGTILAAHLVRDAKEPFHILLIDASGDFGPGLAYGVNDPCFLLNVRAERMGAFADKPGHFYEWMIQNPKVWREMHPSFMHVDYGPGDFVPRMIYGAYLRSILRETERSAIKKKGKITRITDAVNGFTPDGTQIKLTFPRIESSICDAVIWAGGNSFARHLAAPSVHVFEAPYEKRFLKHSLDGVEKILIFGTGLSMVDTMQVLEKKKFKGKVIAISRHGLLPLSHQQEPKHHAPILSAEAGNQRASRIIRNIRNSLKSGEWQDKIDSLRSVSNEVWRNLTPQKQNKLARVSPWWNIARHRIPDFIHDSLQAKRKSGLLQVVKGEIQTIAEGSDGLAVQLKNKTVIHGDMIINCAGFDYSAKNLQKICPAIPLNIFWNGNVAPVEGWKFKLSANHAVFALGPPLHGFYFESTAVHEIRVQTATLVDEIKKSL